MPNIEVKRWYVALRDHMPRSEKDRNYKKCIFSLPVNLFSISTLGITEIECKGGEVKLI